MNILAVLVQSVPVVVSFLLGVVGVGRAKGVTIVVCVSVVWHGYYAWLFLVAAAVAGAHQGSEIRAMLTFACGLAMSVIAFLCGQQSR